MEPRRATLIACGVSSVFALTACDRLERAKECRALANQVNVSLDRIRAARKTGPEEAASLRNIAAEYDALAKGLIKEVKPTSKVAPTMHEYATLVGQSAHDSRAYADALDLKDQGRLEALRATSAHVVKRETIVLAKFDQYCRGK